MSGMRALFGRLWRNEWRLLVIVLALLPFYVLIAADLLP